MDTLLYQYENKAGKNGRYQVVILLIIAFLWINQCFLMNSLPYLQFRPTLTLIYNDQPEQIIKLNKQNCIVYKDILQGILPPEIQAYKINKIGYSISSEYDFYCDEDSFAFMNFLAYSGAIVGYILCSLFNQKLGRKYSLLISCAIGIVAFIFPLLLKNKYIIFTCFFIYNISAFLGTTTGYLYINEICSNEKRTLFCGMVSNSNSLSIIYYVTLLYLIDSWKITLLLNIIINLFLFILITLILVESPKTYLMNKDFDNYKKSLNYIAKFNNKNDTIYQLIIKDEQIKHQDKAFLEDDIVKIELFFDENENKTIRSLKDIFIYPSVRFSVIVFSLYWFTDIGMYFANTVNIKNLEGNIFFLGYMDGFIQLSLLLIL